MYVCIACGYVYDPEKGDPDSGIAPGMHNLWCRKRYVSKTRLILLKKLQILDSVTFLSSNKVHFLLYHTKL